MVRAVVPDRACIEGSIDFFHLAREDPTGSTPRACSRTSVFITAAIILQ